jgi:flagellar biosynthetic protein FliR
MELEIATSTLVGFSLALVRTTAWIVICPPFNSPAIPKRVRVGLAAAIAFVLAGQLGEQQIALSLGSFVLTLLAQALAGLALGFAVLVLYSAIQAAGDMIDMQVGYSMAAVLDPVSGANAAPIARFYQLVGLMVLFAVNGHLLVVEGYLRSVEAVPMGELHLAVFAHQLIDLIVMFMVAAAEIALPVLAALFCTEVALGLIGKAAPGLNILVMGLAAKTMVALTLLGLTLVWLPEATESLIAKAVRAAGAAFGG